LAGAVHPPITANSRQSPGTPFKAGLPPVFQIDPRTDDEVPDRRGDEHLPGARECGNAGCDVHRNSGDLPPDHLDLASVKTGANLEVELSDGARNRSGAADRPTGFSRLNDASRRRNA
jgi:hypothetical protein